MSQKGGIWIYLSLLGLLIILVVGVTKFMSGKSVSLPIIASPTQNALKSYIDPDFKFSLKYPDSKFELVNDSENDYSKRGLTDFRKNFAGYVTYQPGDLAKPLVWLSK